MAEARVSMVDEDQADPEAEALYGELEDAYGMVLNMAKALGHNGELDADVFSLMADLQGTTLPGKDRELAYTYVSHANGCEY